MDRQAIIQKLVDELEDVYQDIIKEKQPCKENKEILKSINSAHYALYSVYLELA